MSQTPDGEDLGQTVRLEAAQAALRDHFLGWQCRLRQLAVREAAGRPTTGMRPLILDLASSGPASGDELMRITVLIVQKEPAEITAQFRHMVRKTQDPAERYDAALKTLAAAYYQRSREFSDEMTALFGPDSSLAARLLQAGGCKLEFEQYNQLYRLPCSARDLSEADPAYQATYWHNSLFNAAIPGGIRILGLQPDWAHAEAEPPVG